MKKDNKKFRISGWFVPATRASIFKRIKQSGLNHIFLQGSNVGNDCRDISVIEKYLTLCDSYGIEAYVQRGRGTDISTVLKNATVFGRYTSFRGYLMCDEPGADQYTGLRKDLREYYTKNGKGDFFVNLLPSYARGDQILENYELYVQTYAREVLSCDMSEEKWLSFDFYPLIFGETKNFTLAERWLYDTQTIAEERKKYGYRANAFVQTMPFSFNGANYGSRERFPSYRDLSLQVYTYLAFGFDGISYFCVGTPDVDEEFSESHYAMFDRAGDTTEIYDSVKRLNKNISSFLDVYTDFSWNTAYMLGNEEEDCYRFLKSRKAFVPTDRIKGVQADGNVIMGAFEGDNAEAFIALNFGEVSMQHRKHIIVEFDKESMVTVWRNGRKEKIKRKELCLSLDPGEGIFVVVK